LIRLRYFFDERDFDFQRSRAQITPSWPDWLNERSMMLPANSIEAFSGSAAAVGAYA
jgi:hypothetical protein